MHRPAAALSGDSLLLHIGPHKTGTTAIQALLASAREDLSAHGITYPGRYSAHHRAAHAVLGRPEGWGRGSFQPPVRPWERLVRTTRAARGLSVVSSEFFSMCDAAQRRRVVEELGGERVHVLVAARNCGALALSNWQQVVRSGNPAGLEEWLEARYRRPRPAPATEGFWSTTEPANLVEQWGEVVAREQIHVVVIDETDRAVLPRAFEQLLGLPEGFLSSRAAQAHNRSLTAAETALLRRAVQLTRGDLDWAEFSLFYRTGFARRLLDHRQPPSDEPRSVLPRWAAEQAEAETESTIARLRDSGVVVLGDLDALRRTPAPGAAPAVDQVPLDLAAQALAGVVTAAQRELRRLREGQSAPAEPSSRELVGELLHRARTRLGRRT